MIQSDNGQLSLAKRSLRSRIPSERWEQIKVAYVSGIGLREIARKLDIPEGYRPCSREVQRLDPTDSGRNAAAIRCNHTSAISASISRCHIERT